MNMFGGLCISSYLKFAMPARRLNSLKSISSRFRSTVTEERIVITDDGSTIVCWHPEKQFPYNFSRPIPEEEVKPLNTVLKIQNKSDLYKVFKTQDKESIKEELAKLTYTTKHRWYPNNRRFRKTFKRIKSDREWL